MSTSENQEINEAIGRVFENDLGGRGSLPEVFRALAEDLPEHLAHHLMATGLKTKIRGYFRKQNADGLPQAPEADAHGTHVQLDLLELAEYKYVIGQQLASSHAARKQAEKMAARCELVHGVRVDLDSLGEDAA